MKVWINEVETKAPQSTLKIIVANKTDLVEERVIKKEDGEKLARKFDALYVECSAKTG